MKKHCILFALIAVFLTGCSSSDVPVLEDHTWVMTTVQSTADNGQAIAYGSDGQSTLDSAVYIDMECKAENGSLTLTDNTNNKTYTGSYELTDQAPDAMNYKVTIDGKEGIAVIAITTYQDETQTPTFIINLGDYTLNFFSVPT